MLKLILALFFLRALVPAGFMPDLAAAQDGVITITICTPQGISTILLDENGAPVDPDRTPEPQTGDHCWFASAGAIDLPETPRNPIPASLTQDVSHWSPQQTLYRERGTSGPLGPRAPPTVS